MKSIIGGGVTEGFALIYDNLETLKKIEPAFRQRKAGFDKPNPHAGTTRKQRKEKKNKVILCVYSFFFVFVNICGCETLVRGVETDLISQPAGNFHRFEFFSCLVGVLTLRSPQRKISVGTARRAAKFAAKKKRD